MIGLKMCPYSIQVLADGGGVSMKCSYSFQGDWAFRHRRAHAEVTPENLTLCFGITDPVYFSFWDKTRIGTAHVRDMEHLDNRDADVTTTTSLRHIGLPALQHQLNKLTEASEKQLFLKQHNVPAVVGCGDRLRSPFCNQYSVQESPCIACDRAIKHVNHSTAEARLLKFHTVTATSEITFEHFDGMKNTHLSEMELLEKLRLAAKGRHKFNQQLMRTHSRLAKLKEHVTMSSKSARNATDIAGIVTIIGDVSNDKDTNEPGDTTTLVKSLVEGLVDNNQHRKFNPEMKHFYSMLLLHGGPQIHEYVADLLQGPSIDTTRRYLRADNTGKLYEFGPERFKFGAKLLKEIGLIDAPCLLVEDGTALITHFDVVQKNEKVIMFGAASGPVEFSSSDEARAFIKEHLVAPRAATMFYLYLLVPLVDCAPSIPVAVLLQDGTKDTYTTKTVIGNWQLAWNALLDEGVRLVGHCGDGAPQFRAASLHHMLRQLQKDGGTCGMERVTSIEHVSTSDYNVQQSEHPILAKLDNTLPTLPVQQPKKYVKFGHTLVQLCVGLIHNKHPIFVCLDFLHVFFRLRNFLLDTKRTPVLFGLPCIDAKLVTHECVKGDKQPLGLCATDLSAADKQNYEACLRLFGYKRKRVKIAGKRCSESEIVEDFTILKAFEDEADYKGLYLYLLFCHRFAKIFLIRSLTPSEVLFECGWCLAFIGYWDMSVTVAKGATKKLNFLTLETKVDLINILNNTVLGIHTFSIFYPHVRYTPWRWSSRYAEYTFQMLRCGCRNNDNRINCMSGLHRIETFQGVLLRSGESKGRNFHVLKNKRGMPMYEGRYNDEWHQMPEGYYPTNAEQVTSVDKGAHALINVLKEPLKKEGCGGGACNAWMSLCKSLPGDTLTELDIDFKVLAEKHLLTQTKMPTTTWVNTFHFGVSPELPTKFIHEDEVSNNKAYEHDDPNTHLENVHPDVKRAFRDDSPVNAHFQDDSDHDEPSGDISPILLSNVGKEGKGRTTVRAMMQSHCELVERNRAELIHEVSKNDAILVDDMEKLEILMSNDGVKLKAGFPRCDLRDCADLLRPVARKWNGIHKPKENTRRGDRFMPPVLEERVDWEDDTCLLEDEDYVAVVQTVQTIVGRKRKQPSFALRYCMVERCMRVHLKKPQRCHVLRANDPDGRLTVRFFIVHEGRDEYKRLRLSLPILSEEGFNHVVECEEVLACVPLLIPEKIDARGLPLLDSKENIVYDDFWRLPRSEETYVKQEFMAFLEKHDINEPPIKLSKGGNGKNRVTETQSRGDNQTTKKRGHVLFLFAPVKAFRVFKGKGTISDGSLCKLVSVCGTSEASSAELPEMLKKLKVEVSNDFRGWEFCPSRPKKQQARKIWFE
jgi:hypothetical protein